MLFTYFLSLTFHVFAAMFWVGGILFYVAVFVSVFRSPEFANYKTQLLFKTALRFREISYYIFAILLVSGTVNIFIKGYATYYAKISTWFLPSNYILTTKLLLFLVLFISSLVHDFVTGPKAMKAVDTDPLMYDRYRRQASFFGRFNMLLSIIIAILGVMVSRGFTVNTFF
jgi:uncharacterized membrane protein